MTFDNMTDSMADPAGPDGSEGDSGTAPASSSGKTSKNTTKKSTKKVAKVAKKTTKKVVKKTAAKKPAEKKAADKKVAKKTTKRVKATAEASADAAEVDVKADAETEATARSRSRRVSRTDVDVAPLETGDAEAAPEVSTEDTPKRTRRAPKKAIKRMPSKLAGTLKGDAPSTKTAKADAPTAGDDDADQADGDIDASDMEASDDGGETQEAQAGRSGGRTRSRSKKAASEGDDEQSSGRTRGRSAERSSERTSERSSSRTSSRSSSKSDDQPPIATPEETKMLISYAPGEECRIAITERGKLTEFDAESFNKLSRVGNIYLGRVTNVEAGVQAAFVDFGGEESGFLHVSDLHPQYFPGADSDETERVGKKTPRRERPPLQQALKKGQMVVVQVIKEGIGTKGPTVTSYLSIPGRFLVMMPNMDKVGVSRKVEDEDQRRAMRKVLDQIELPEGFGFILRTAGMDRNKTELKRDLSYLQRLWKAMEKAQAEGGKGGAKKPRLLYAESDLLVRSLRDQLSSDIGEVVIDHELALERAGKFMKIVAPRSSVKLTHYRGTAPMFHAFGVEEQVRTMHSNEVPLESGGRLVIDETEALVAIDVNSGRMRGARDAETNAYRVNLEAVDEICRQLRLRDLGGLVLNDLIDMRDAKHRKAIENRFLQHLKRDRAKSTILPISQFGILEMTRQRMRGSQQSQHFVTCPSCSGRGLLKRPGTVVAEALRDLIALLDHPKVSMVEVVVSPRVAGTLLSERRGSLGRIERRSGKRVDVRVSEALPPDRVAFYAYDGNGADVDLEKLKQPKINAKTDLVPWDYAADLGSDIDDFASDPEGEAKLIAEREHAEAAAAEHELLHSTADVHPIEVDAPADDEEEQERKPSRGRASDRASDADETDEEGNPKKKRRRRRRRRGKGGEGTEDGTENASENASENSDETASENRAENRAEAGSESGERDSDAGSKAADRQAGDDSEQQSSDDDVDEDGAPRKKRRRRRRRRGGKGGEGGDGESGSESGAHAGSESESQTDTRADSADTEASVSEEKPKRSRRRGRKSESSEATGSGSGSDSGSGRGSGKSTQRATEQSAPRSAPVDNDPPTVSTPTVKRKRTLYGGSRRSLAPSEKAKIKASGDRS